MRSARLAVACVIGVTTLAGAAGSSCASAGDLRPARADLRADAAVKDPVLTVLRWRAAIVAADADQLATLLAPTIRTLSADAALSGSADSINAYRAMFAKTTGMCLSLQDVFIAGDTAIVTWRSSATRGGAPYRAVGADVLVIDHDGKITEDREYEIPLNGQAAAQCENEKQCGEEPRPFLHIIAGPSLAVSRLQTYWPWNIAAASAGRYPSSFKHDDLRSSALQTPGQERDAFNAAFVNASVRVDGSWSFRGGTGSMVVLESTVSVQIRRTFEYRQMRMLDVVEMDANDVPTKRTTYSDAAGEVLRVAIAAATSTPAPKASDSAASRAPSPPAASDMVNAGRK